MSLGFTVLVIFEIFASVTLVLAILKAEVFIRAENRLVNAVAGVLRRIKRARAARRRAKLNTRASFTPEIPPFAA